MTMKSLFVYLSLFCLAGISALGADGAPKFIEYQGTVLDNSGQPLAPTTPRLFLMEFRLWDQLEAGTLIWSERQYVTVLNGQFTARLGEGQMADDAVAPQVAQAQLDLAFAGKDRFLGVTVVNPPAAKSEMTPRLAMLSTPYAVVANEASSLVQQPGTSSSLVAGAIAYSTQTTAGQATLNLALDKRTNLIAAAGAGTVATLPSDGNLTELVVVKTDNTTQYVTVAAPSGGTINRNKSAVRLKVKGESVTLQNIGGNNWWIVKDSRDRTQVGTIIAYGGANPPAGYLPCDGTPHLRTAHPDLFDAIGSTWGASSSNMAALPPNAQPGATGTTTHFNVPNLSHRFLRGVNPGSNGEDEDAGSRFRIYAGGGVLVGSYQLDSLRRHLHSITDPGHTHTATIIAGLTAKKAHYVGDGEGNSGYSETSGEIGSKTYTLNYSTTVNANTTGITRTANVTGVPAANIAGVPPITGIPETRPDSAVVRYCIKY